MSLGGDSLGGVVSRNDEAEWLDFMLGPDVEEENPCDPGLCDLLFEDELFDDELLVDDDDDYDDDDDDDDDNGDDGVDDVDDDDGILVNFCDA